MIWLISMYAAQVIVGRWVGEKILGVGEPGMGPALGRLALGLVALRLISMLPYVGGWVMFGVVISGHRRDGSGGEPAFAPARAGGTGCGGVSDR